MENKQNGKHGASFWDKLRAGLVKLLKFLCNPRLLLCFGIAWMITNGWSYALLGIGTYLESAWMIGIATSYLTLLWFPFTPEKVLTVIIAIWLLTRLFPNDEKTLAVLRTELQKAKDAVKKHKKKKQDNDRTPPEDN